MSTDISWRMAWTMTCTSPATRLYLDELERDGDLAADSVVVNHYTVTI